MLSKTDGKSRSLTAFLLHIHPRKVHVDTIRFTLSFGLGGMSVTLLVALFTSGVIQLLSYSTEIPGAYTSVVKMYTRGNPAGFIRNIHHWCGNLLVVVTFLHMLRVLLTGALTEGRRYNWCIGIVLLLSVLFMNFTGYLLPWDQLAYWAVTIFTSMMMYVPVVGGSLAELLRGGQDVGQQTLSVFFALHVGVLPALIVYFVFRHFWLIRKAGGLIRRENVSRSRDEMVLVRPHLIRREIAFALGLLAVVCLYSALVDAPLGNEANPGESPNPAKAAWYFMGLQELLLHIHPVFAVCIVPATLVSVFLFLPYWKNATLPGGVWFGGGNGVWIACWSVAAGFCCVIFAVLVDHFLPDVVSNPDNTLLYRGILPYSGYVLLMVAWYAAWRGKGGCRRAKAAMGIVMFTVAVAIGLTVVGVFFRGPGMSLVLPG